jgi:hypothetical protein
VAGGAQSLLPEGFYDPRGVSVLAAPIKDAESEPMGHADRERTEEEEEGHDGDAGGWVTAGRGGRTVPAPGGPHAHPISTDTAQGKDDDDDAGWITPSNVAALRAQHRGAVAAAAAVEEAAAAQQASVVACITADFALQARRHRERERE